MSILFVSLLLFLSHAAPICEPDSVSATDISEQWISYNRLADSGEFVAVASDNTTFSQWEVECLFHDFTNPATILSAVMNTGECSDSNCTELHILKQDWSGNCMGWYRFRMLMSSGSCSELSIAPSSLSPEANNDCPLFQVILRQERWMIQVMGGGDGIPSELSDGEFDEDLTTFLLMAGDRKVWWGTLLNDVGKWVVPENGTNFATGEWVVLLVDSNCPVQRLNAKHFQAPVIASVSEFTWNDFRATTMWCGAVVLVCGLIVNGDLHHARVMFMCMIVLSWVAINQKYTNNQGSFEVTSAMVVFMCLVVVVIQMWLLFQFCSTKSNFVMIPSGPLPSSLPTFVYVGMFSFWLMVQSLLVVGESDGVDNVRWPVVLV